MSADLWTWCEWTPDIAARELLTGPGAIDNETHWELAMKIREAIIHGSLPAERRAKKVWFVDHHEELTDYYSAPAEVIRWAIHAGVDVPQPYLDWYRTHVPQAEPALVEESQAKPRAHTQDRAAHLAAVLDEIEARALELNHPFDRAEWPGTKDEFRNFLKWRAPRLFYSLQTNDKRLSRDELRPHGVKFGRPGRNKTKGLRFYRALFPDFPA